MQKKKDDISLPPTKIAVFKNREIRRTLHDNEWWFSVVDVAGALTNSVDPSAYWRKLKERLKEEESEVVTNCHGLKLPAPDGKLRETDCANTEGIFRIIQSIPSPKAEPFKRWLAKVGYQRIQEIENPELAIKRTRDTYQLKGYSDEWIEKRIRGIEVRKNLTDEWKKRGVKGEDEYSILTSEISKAAFGLTPEEYKKHKGLDKPNENLRDHMTDLELIFNMLSEAATTEIAQKRDVVGFEPNKKAAIDGGTVAGNARKDLEKQSGRRVVSAVNYKQLPEKKIRKLLES
jgi:DNA-damage-inducible protein D